MTSGTTVKVTTGKFKGQQGTVVDIRTDKDGTTRTQVRLAGGIFSYMPTSLEFVATDQPSATVRPTITA